MKSPKLVLVLVAGLVATPSFAGDKVTKKENKKVEKKADKANRKIRKKEGLVGEDVDVHEIKPVKFNGSPTDRSNKVILDRKVHRQKVTPWWNKLMKDLGF